MQEVNFLVSIRLLHHFLVEVQKPGDPITECNFEVALSFVLIKGIIQCILQGVQGFLAIGEVIIRDHTF